MSAEPEKPLDPQDAYAAAPPGRGRLVLELHELTALPMLECRKYLMANGWDLARAREAIRKEAMQRQRGPHGSDLIF